MKELPKRQIEQRKDDSYSVQYRQKAIIQSVHQVRGSRKKQAGNRNSEQHEKRHHVLSKLLDGDCSAISRSAEERQRHSCKHHHCRDIKDVESNGRLNCAQMKCRNLLPEHERLINILIGRQTFKMYPSK